jgi:hypothetical protein
MADAKTLWIYDYSQKSYLAEIILPIANSCRYWFAVNGKEVVTAVGDKGIGAGRVNLGKEGYAFFCDR